MSKYDPPKDEEMFLSHFGNSSKKRIKKSLMEFIFFIKDKRIFINYEILSTNALLCAMADGITILRYDNKKSPMFIDSQWIIDEKIDGEEFYTEIKRLTDELRSNETLWKQVSDASE